jgi:hypothetical protein
LIDYVERSGELQRAEPSVIKDVHELPESEVVVEAIAIRDILIGKKPPKGTPPLADPQGIRIHRARILGPLNLDGITTTIGLQLTNCRLDQPLELADATMHRLVLEGCVLPGAWADRAKIDTFTMQGCLVNGKYAEGALRFTDAHVTIDLRLTGTTIQNDAGPAVRASGLTVDAYAYLDALTADGAVILTGATVGGDLTLRGAKLTAGPHPALRGENLTVKGAALLDDGFTATGGGTLGAVSLASATITRQLSLRTAVLTGAGGPALRADLITVQSSLLMDERFTAEGGNGELAAVQLKGAKISGDLRLDGGTLTNTSGPALAADLLTVQGDLTMTGSATGHGGLPAVQLRGASITGQLSLQGATVDSGRIPGQTASADSAAVCLTGATVSGDLVLRRATVRSEAGPALLADYLTVKGDAFRCEEDVDRDVDDAHRTAFRADGQGVLGAVCLAGATISGQVALRGAILTGTGGPALVADSATIAGDVFLDKRFKASGGTRLDAASGGSKYATVRMVETTIGRGLHCSGQALRDQLEVPALDLRSTQVGTWYLSESFAANSDAEQGSTEKLLSCDGLKYAQRPKLLDGNSPVDDDDEQAKRWTSYLKDHAVYSAQAYQQLATAFQAVGNDDAARKILIKQRDDAIHRGGLSPLNRFWQHVLGRLIGYGYRSVNALYWLAGLFAVTALLAVCWFGPFALIQPVSSTTATAASTAAATTTTTTATTEPKHCSFTAQLSYAIDVAFPIITISSSSEQQCDVASPNPNQLLVAFGWLVRALSATLIAIYGAGLTGLTSRSPGS